MRIALVALLVLATTGPLIPVGASARPLQCSGATADRGDDRAAVAAKCGRPLARQTACGALLDMGEPGATLQPSINTPCREVERWSYRPAAGQPPTTLTFESGRLKAIDTDDRPTQHPNDAR